jgi:small subunit ribosomal protein S12
MSTLNQVIKKPRKKPLKSSKSFNHQPFAAGICLKVFIKKPKKPNSALRKVARIKLSTGKIINAHIGGEGHNLQQYAKVLVRGGRCRDLPGVKHRLIRGKYDLACVDQRKNSRSKYGTPKSK